MPKFSVIIPVYKVEDYLDECVTSVVNQTFTDIEIILVDDGSPDNCPAKCDEWAERDSRIHVIHKENGGLSDARNCGLDNANGEYIIFLDSDDYWNTESAIEKLYDNLEKNNSDIVVFGCTDFNMITGEQYISRSDYDYSVIDKNDKDETFHYFLSELKLPGAAYVFAARRSVIELNHFRFKTGIQDEDYDYVLNVFLNAKSINAIDDAFYMYRQGRKDSITKTASIKMIKGIEYTIQKWVPIAKTVENKTIQNDILNYLSYIYSTGFVLCGRMNKELRREALDIMKQYKFVLRYAYWNSVKLVRILSSLMGFNLFSLFISKYYDLTHNR